MVLTSALWVTIFVSPSLVIVAARALWVTIWVTLDGEYDIGKIPATSLQKRKVTPLYSVSVYVPVAQ